MLMSYCFFSEIGANWSGPEACLDCMELCERVNIIPNLSKVNLCMVCGRRGAIPAYRFLLSIKAH